MCAHWKWLGFFGQSSCQRLNSTTTTPNTMPIPVPKVTDEEVEATQETVTFDQIEQIADDGLRTHILAKNPYEFQDLVAALLRGMGYYTPFVAPRGKDGGIDIIVYRDPLGAASPRIKVQVRHRPETAAGVKELRELMGILFLTLLPAVVSGCFTVS